MSEKSSKNMRDDLEGFLKDVLSGDTLQNALRFTEYLKADCRR